MESVKIVKHVPEDAGDVVDFLNTIGKESQYVSIEETGFHLSVAEEEDFIRSADEKNHVLVGARDASTGELLGTASAFRGELRSRHVFTLGVSVKRKAHRRGIGTALMKAVMDEARRRGARKLILYVCAPNIQAIRLYEKLDFRQEGRLKENFRMSNGHFVDELIMAYFYPDDDELAAAE